MKAAHLVLWTALASVLLAQKTVTLPEVTVHSPRVAIQSPAATFAMPVSALRYEPGVDIQARNLAEAQADITVRGGIFENTGFQVGAVTLWDPQTGHYFAEIPIAPAMLGVPQIVTGAELATGLSNATAGAVTYGWRPVKTRGAASIGFGEHRLRRGDLYQGYLSEKRFAGRAIAADVAFAQSRMDGAIPFGDHDFSRVNGRVQFAGDATQTDLFAGYQEKFFGWPNLYTPFNSNETENLQTVLLAVNHRIDFAGDGFFEVGAYHRRNKDDYAFNRFAPVGPAHPFQHTTWITGVAAGGRHLLPAFAMNYRAEVLADELRSTALTFGRYRSRTLAKFSLLPEKSWPTKSGDQFTLQAGATLDHGNRHDAAVSPVVELARQSSAASSHRLHLSYSEATQVPTYTALSSSAAAGLFRGNPKLGRQRSRNLEAGWAGRLAGWSGAVAMFWRRDDALVDWTFQRGVIARSANAVDIDVGGIEVFGRRTVGIADFVIGYTLLRKDADFRHAAVDASFYALNYPRHRATFALTVRLGSDFELRLDNVARMHTGNILRTVGGDRALTSSVALVYRPPAWRRVELSVQADNLWDSDFQEVPAVPASPRQIALGVASTW